MPGRSECPYFDVLAIFGQNYEKLLKQGKFYVLKLFHFPNNLNNFVIQRFFCSMFGCT